MTFRQSLLASAVALTIGFLAHSAQAAPNLITNGNFEAGQIGLDATINNVTAYGWTLDNAAANTTYGYTNFGGYWFGGGSAAQNGAIAMIFGNGEQAPSGTVSQQFNTTIGESYRVSFDYGPGGWYPSNLALSAYVLSDSSVNLGGVIVNGFNAITTLLPTWTFDFTAISTLSILYFADISSSSYATDGILDNVSVASTVPAPGTLALLGLGLLGIAGLRRRKAL